MQRPYIRLRQLVVLSNLIKGITNNFSTGIMELGFSNEDVKSEIEKGLNEILGKFEMI